MRKVFYLLHTGAKLHKGGYTMKKFYAILVVLALTLVSAVAMAEVTVSGSIEMRNLATNNTQDFSSKNPGYGTNPAGTADSLRNTQERIRLNIDAKNDGVKGRFTIENDWDVWGRVEAPQANATVTPSAGTATTDAGRLKIREGWIDFQLPGLTPAHVKVGHQFLALGNGWFFRSGKYGSDAWLVGLPGKNTVAFVNVKAGENSSYVEDDIDAYVLLDNYKITDNQTVGVYFARVNDPRGAFVNSLFNTGGGAAPAGAEATLDTIGLWFNGKLGPINLQAELNVQSGKAKSPGDPDTKFKGNQLVLQANMPIDPLTINATLAQGSGQDIYATTPSNDLDQMMTLLDADPHYTFVYEYLVNTACIKSVSAAGLPAFGKNTGFCNTTAANIGAGYKVSKNLSIQADFWMLKSVEKVDIGGGAGANGSDDLGTELDIVVKWNLYDQLSWNWQLGRMMPGKAYDRSATVSADPIDAVQGILSYKF
jgi:hypothetical protein